MTTTATAADTILALDLGKYKSVASVWYSALDQRFTRLATSRDELPRLIHKHRPAVVLIETCHAMMPTPKGPVASARSVVYSPRGCLRGQAGRTNGRRGVSG